MKLLRALLLVISFTLNGVTAAFASQCGFLFAAQNLEARISYMRENTPRGQPGEQLQPLLDQLFEGVGRLNENHYRDPDLAFAVRNYQMSIADISRSEFDRPVAVAQLLVGPRHRALVRRMIKLADEICGNASIDMSVFEAGQGQSVEWQLTGGVSLVSLIIAAGSAYVLAVLYRLRVAQRRRYYCQIPVHIQTSDGEFASEMLDISALGAKIKKPAPAKPDEDADEEALEDLIANFKATSAMDFDASAAVDVNPEPVAQADEDVISEGDDDPIAQMDEDAIADVNTDPARDIAVHLTGPLQLTIDAEDIQASIQWQNDYFFGVQFKKALDQKRLRQLINDHKDGEETAEPVAPATT